VLPKELDKIFNEFDEDDFELYITKADFSGDNFIIDFVLDVQDINDRGEISQNWSIEAIGHRKNQISFDFAENIEIKDDHPLLWDFTDLQCQLYFSGRCKEPTKLFYDLYSAHKSLFGQHKCFNISFGEETAYFKPFQYTNGLLTKGSKNLMQKYAECLKKNGLDFNIIGESPAKYWDGKQFIEEAKNLKLLVFGDTYIIAKDFSFTQQTGNSKF
jgi:hypothetical protein